MSSLLVLNRQTFVDYAALLMAIALMALATSPTQLGTDIQGDELQCVEANLDLIKAMRCSFQRLISAVQRDRSPPDQRSYPAIRVHAGAPDTLHVTQIAALRLRVCRPTRSVHLLKRPAVSHRHPLAQRSH